MTIQLARETDKNLTIGIETIANSTKLDWPVRRDELLAGLAKWGQLDPAGLEAEASAIGELLHRCRDALGSLDPFGDEGFDADTPAVVLLGALVRLTSVRSDRLAPFIEG